MKNFDLFIADCNKFNYNIDYIINKINEKIGTYISVINIGKDDNSCFCRNFVPGSISLLEYINNSDNIIRTGYQKAQTNNNGICLFSYNLSSEYKHYFKNISEDFIIDRIVNAFYWGIGLAKQLNHDIIGDGYELINRKLSELNINTKIN